MVKAISPKVWGISGWSLLHRLSFCFTKASEATQFFQTLEHILPCPKCRKNMADHYKNLAFPKKASDFPVWVWKLHDRVNSSISGDKQAHDSPSFAEVRDIYLGACHVSKACEATFLLAIAETHPGVRQATPEYIGALSSFIRIYFEKSSINGTLPDATTLRSRPAFRTWVEKITKTRQHFDQCV
jgi:hypothetical protein